MSLNEYTKGSIICSNGEPLQKLSTITKGVVEATFNGHKFSLEKGDMIGLCGLSTGNFNQNYIASSDVTVFSYPYENFDALEALLRNNAEISYRMVNSMCRQISRFLQYWSSLKQEANTVFNSLAEIHQQYEHLCAANAFASRKILGLSGITAFSERDPVEDWVHNYYLEIRDLDPDVRKGFFNGNPGISSGFLRRGKEDFYQVLQVCRVYQEYMNVISKFYLNGDENDLFALVSELHFGSISIKGAEAGVETLMMKLTIMLSKMTGIDAAYYQKRLNTYRNDLQIKRSSADAPAASGTDKNLSNQLDIILDYSECPIEIRSKFTRYVQDYTKLSDRGSSDDVINSECEEIVGLE